MPSTLTRKQAIITGYVIWGILAAIGIWSQSAAGSFLARLPVIDSALLGIVLFFATLYMGRLSVSVYSLFLSPKELEAFNASVRHGIERSVPPLEKAMRVLYPLFVLLIAAFVLLTAWGVYSLISS